MDTTFNNGLGMIFVIGKQEAGKASAMLKAMGERCFVIGDIRKGAKGVTISS
jgi:phosphoribosylformylglycinamidine cyclo-ligase